MRRTLAFFLCFAATSGFAQDRLNGKWATDRPTEPQLMTDAQRRQSVQLEVSLEGDKASGSLTLGGLGGTFYTFKEGKVTGDKVQFRTDPRTETTWTIEMVDDNTVMLYHGPFEIVGNNVLDLISLLGGLSQPQPVVQVAAVSLQGAAKTSISGVVQDQSKAFIPGVSVTATNVDTGVKTTTVTNESGRYGLFSLIPGNYTMSASIPGFKTTVSNLSFADTPVLQDFTLEIATPRAVSPSIASCSRTGIMWCSVLHRAK
jgi:Carboxypeptidase regulatory-like domain